MRPEEVFPADWIVACTERSLRKLGLETIDVHQLHVWSDEWVGQGDWLDAIERLKRDGKIRFFGVSINDHEPENAIRLVETGRRRHRSGDLQRLRPEPRRTSSSPPSRAAGVGVIVRVPFDEGALTGSVRPETDFSGGRLPERVLRAASASARCGNACRRSRDLDVEVERLAEIALRFCLSHPATDVVIPGMRTLEHVEANARAIDAGPLSEEQLSALRAHRWDRNFYR